MNEKEILEQLNKFQQIKPDAAWKKSNRDILLSQISNSQSREVEYSWFANFRIQLQALTSVSQPALAVVLIMLFIISGGTFGLRASRDTKPGDSLYIAKLVSERAQLATTFNQQKKTDLSREFASNRVEELSQVLAGKNEMTEADRQELSKLVDSLKKDIINVKNQAGNTQVAVENNPVEEEEGGMVFTAGSGRTENGLQVSDSPSSKTASSTEVVNNDPQTILKQAKELLQQSDYDAALSKLDEATKMVSGDNGEVKGVEASSTESITN